MSLSLVQPRAAVIARAVILAAAFVTACGGAVVTEAASVGAGAPVDGGALEAGPVSPVGSDGGETATVVSAVYGAEYQGDAGMCATVICSGGQVCCVVPIASDAATPRPNNRCDYNCMAACMDSCPYVATGDAAASAPVHGGGIAAPTTSDDGG